MRDTSQAGGSRAAARAQEAPCLTRADDGRFGFGVVVCGEIPTRELQLMAKTLDGVTGLGGETPVSNLGWTVPMRTSARRYPSRAVEARPGDEATVAELDIRLEDWVRRRHTPGQHWSTELKSVAADFYLSFSFSFSFSFSLAPSLALALALALSLPSSFFPSTHRLSSVKGKR